MIGRIAGIILDKVPHRLLLDVNGLGYEVETSLNSFYRLPDLGCKICLHTHLVIREDAQQLYGFIELMERELFRLLIKVSGVGPKTAVGILSSINVNEFVFCIQSRDATRLAKLPGIGKKTAERLLIEMQDKLKDWQIQNVQQNGQELPAKQEAIAALVALGYKHPEANRLLSKINDTGLNSEEMIRLALKSVVE